MNVDWNWLQGLTTAIVVPAEQSIRNYIGPVLAKATPYAIGMGSLFAATQFIRLAAHKITIEDVFLSLVTTSILVWLVSNQGDYMQWIGTPVLTTIPADISSAFGGNGAPAAGFDNILKINAQAFGKAMQTLPWSFASIPISGFLMAWIALVFVLTFVSWTVYIDGFFGVLVAVFIGPIFVCFGIHPATRHLFRGWITLAVGAMTQQVLCVAVLGITTALEITSLTNSIAAWAVSDSSFEWFIVLLQNALVVTLCTLATFKTTKFAHTIAGGAHGSSAGAIAYMAVNAVHSGAAAAAKAVTGTYHKISGSSGGDGGGSSGGSGGGAQASVRRAAPGRNLSRGP